MSETNYHFKTWLCPTATGKPSQARDKELIQTMLTSQLHHHLEPTSAIITTESDGMTVVKHFGDLQAEANAVNTSAGICPLAGFIRIRATGNDRAKFLHNFCTNNINELPVGSSCEVFFPDVKAKILAHGYVLAAEDFHEIWMLPGDESTILQHLNRYIITEDVTIETVGGDWQTFALMGPDVSRILHDAKIVGAELSPDTCSTTDSATAVSVTWSETPLVLLSVSAENATQSWQSCLDAGALACGEIVFTDIRIKEGFPIIGVDLSNDNLAPEADRNSKAISYTKGCYLGQEPIARLDAMGHVNRKLYRATIGGLAESVNNSDDLPQITSASEMGEQHPAVLIPMKVKYANGGTTVRAQFLTGEIVELTNVE